MQKEAGGCSSEKSADSLTVVKITRTKNQLAGKLLPNHTETKQNFHPSSAYPGHYGVGVNLKTAYREKLICTLDMSV